MKLRKEWLAEHEAEHASERKAYEALQKVGAMPPPDKLVSIPLSSTAFSWSPLWLINDAVCLAKRALEKRAPDPSSTRPRRAKKHRRTHCFSCKSPLDNAVDKECPTCGWVACPHCGACGCDYPSSPTP